MIHVRRTAVRCCPVSLHRVAAAAALLGAQLGASAQQSATPDASAAPEAGKLPTVTVTAERRRENARDVPNSVSVINPSMIEKSGLVATSSGPYSPRNKAVVSHAMKRTATS